MGAGGTSWRKPISRRRSHSSSTTTDTPLSIWRKPCVLSAWSWNRPTVHTTNVLGPLASLLASAGRDVPPTSS